MDGYINSFVDAKLWSTLKIHAIKSFELALMNF